MKRIISLTAALLIFLSGCSSAPEVRKTVSESKKMHGIWITYAELDNMAQSGDFEKSFSECVKKLTDFGITDIFLHTVAFCDAVYPSEIYPKRNGYQNIDALKIAVNTAHKNGMRLHAWLNPYRVRTADCDIKKLPQKNPAAQWLSDDDRENDKNVCVIEGMGIFLNPAEGEVRRTVIGAVREIIENYDVDGIHFDDYFYPTADPCFDSESYQKYSKSSTFPLTLSEWRRSAVNALVSGCYTAIKFENSKISFSISPAASIQKNYDTLYADVRAWCKSGCVDMIIPQLYFGFSYPQEEYCFTNLLNAWKEAAADTDVSLCIGLAAYKTGIDTAPDCDEWGQSAETIVKETELVTKDKTLTGEVFFSYSSVFCTDPLKYKAAEGIKKCLSVDRN